MELSPFERLQNALYGDDDFFCMFADMLENDPMAAKYIIYTILIALGIIGLMLFVTALAIILGPKGLLLGSGILIVLGCIAAWELIQSLKK